MNKIHVVEFTSGTTAKTITGLFQWNFGQILQIKGLDLPSAVEVHFALRRSGEAIRRIGVTKDGVTEVEIPDVLFKTMMTSDYDIYAYVYVSDEEYGSTTHEIVMKVKSRPMPEDIQNNFDELMKAVNALAEVIESTTPRVNTAEVGQIIAVKEVDDNGVPTAWESIDNFSGSWNDLEDKPFCEEEAEFDIIPEQTCVVTDGVITADLTQDLTSDYDGLTGYLVINDVVYEGTLSWFNVAWFYTGTFGDYEFSNNEITLSENTSLNDGDEVTVRLYVNATQIETLDEKYLPSKYVSCETDQELTETQKTKARLNIGAMSKSAIEKIVILEDGEEVRLSSSSIETIKVSLPDFLYTYDFDFLEIISQYREDGSSYYNDIRILVPVKSDPSTYTSYRQRIYSDEYITVGFFADDSGTPSIVINLTNDGRSSMMFDLQTINGYKLDINTTYIE